VKESESRSEKSARLDAETRQIVVDRDNGRCVLCGAVASSIHEIVSKSHWGTRKLEICFSERNRACLCNECHLLAQGNPDYTALILAMLNIKWHYKYPEREFKKYLG